MAQLGRNHSRATGHTLAQLENFSRSTPPPLHNLANLKMPSSTPSTPRGGQSTKQIQKHLTKKQLDQAEDFYTVIERLQMKGLIRINERGLYVRKETA